MKTDKLKGIIAPLLTPFTEDGVLDEEKVAAEIRLLADAKVDGISPGGSTGEGAALSDDELATMIRIIRRIAPEMLIVAGVIRVSTKDAVKTGMIARQAGADALMVTPVFYNVLVPDEEGNFVFYQEIAKTVGLPIVIYNVVPQNTITPQQFSRLLHIPEVVGIKQSCGGIASFYDMRMCNPDGKIFSATDEMLFSTFELGADGAISAILTAFPEQCVEMWTLAQQGNHQKGMEIQNRLYFIWKAIAGNQFPLRIKYALKLLGRDAGMTRSPICHLSEAEKDRIAGALRQAGF